MKKTKKDTDIREIQAPAESIIPLFSNVTSVYPHEDFVIVDFGFFAPPYSQDSDYFEDTQIARMCFPWDTIEELSRILVSVLDDRKKRETKKKSKSSKV